MRLQRARFELVEVDELGGFHAGFGADLHELGDSKKRRASSMEVQAEKWTIRFASS